MKKMYSKISLILTLIIGILAAPFPAFAADSNSENLVRENTIVTDKFIDENLVGTVSPNRIVPFNNQGESQVTSGNYTTKKTVTVTPTGQPGLGYEGKSGGMVFFFKSGGSSQKFTVTINYKSFTFTAETGKTASYGSGYGASVPSTSGYYRFQFIKNYTIKSKKIDVYKYNVYQYSYYVHDPQYSLSHKWAKI